MEKLLAKNCGTDGKPLTPQNIADFTAKIQRLRELTEQAMEIWAEDMRAETAAGGS